MCVNKLYYLCSFIFLLPSFFLMVYLSDNKTVQKLFERRTFVFKKSVFHCTKGALLHSNLPCFTFQIRHFFVGIVL